jgi:hypothetical protein
MQHGQKKRKIRPAKKGADVVIGYCEDNEDTLQTAARYGHR